MAVTCLQLAAVTDRSEFLIEDCLQIIAELLLIENIMPELLLRKYVNVPTYLLQDGEFSCHELIS